MKDQDVKLAGFIRVGALGDILVSTAALEETFSRFPSAEILAIGDRMLLEILSPQRWPRLRGIVVIDGGRGALHLPNPGWVKVGEPRPLRDFYKMCQAIVNTRYESYRFSWAPWFHRVPMRFGSCPAPMKWLYTHWAPWLGKDPLVHERDLNLRIVQADPKKWKSKGLPALKDVERDELESRTGLKFKKYVLFNPTASRWEKAWPAEKFRELVSTLEGDCRARGLLPVVIGSPKETEWLQKAAGSGVSIQQPKNIGELIDVVAGARMLIANTSSMQFIANAQDTPVLTLMGQAPRETWGPLRTADMCVRGQVPAGFRGNLFERDFAAYSSITVSEVAAAARKMLAAPET